MDRPIVQAALAYMVTGLAVFLLMGILGLLMRLTHGGIVEVSPDWFYRIMTLHGTGMVAGVMLASMGAFAAVLRPVVRLSARVLWTAFVLYFLGAGFAIIATLIGGFAAGWTVLHPLPYESSGVWSLWAALAMYVGYLFVALGFLLYCVHMLLAIRSVYGGIGRALAWRYLVTGGRTPAEPMPRPVDLVGAVVAIDGIITVLAGAIYLVPLFIEASGAIGRVDALFAKNFLFLFGHTFANLNIYLAAGLVYSTLPRFTGRPWRTSWPVVLALNLVIVLVLMPYFHHLYQDFAQPLPLQIIGQVGSYLVAMPALLVTILGGVGLIYRSGLRWSVPSVLIALGLWGWTIGGVAAVLDSTIGINQVMHNTLWVPGHFHTYYLLGAVTFTIAFMYYLVTRLSGTEERGASRTAAWLYGAGGTGFVLMFLISGALGVPRRFAQHEPGWEVFAQIAVPFVILLAIGLGWLATEISARLRAAWTLTGALPE